MRIKQTDKAEQTPDDAPDLDAGELLEAELDEDVIEPDGAVEFKRGDTVLIRAVIIHPHDPAREPAYQTLSLQLNGDGQGIHTNIGNVSPLPDEGETVGEKAQKPARNKARKADFNKETVLIGGVPVLREAFEFLATDWLETQKEADAQK